MNRFNKIAIIGLGLIGGSIALAIKKKRLAKSVIGVSRHERTLNLAKKNRLIAQGSTDLAIIKDADLVILAAPVEVILKLSRPIAKIIKANTIVTDVGSAKEKIVAKLEKIFPNFIGGHPLAGSEKRGLVNARGDIFLNSLCILTPTKRTSQEAKLKVARFWKELGAKVSNLSPDAHDKIISFTSCLPHLIAFSLINSVPKQCLKFAASGLKDTTRIAASEPGLWADIFLSNKNSLKSIQVFQTNLEQIKKAIQHKDGKSLKRALSVAKAKRDALK